MRLPGRVATHADAAARARAARVTTDGPARAGPPLATRRLRTHVPAGHQRDGAARSKLSIDAVLWALKSLVLDRLSVARIVARPTAVFAKGNKVQAEATWFVYQLIVAAYRDPDRAPAKTKLQAISTSVTRASGPRSSSYASSAARSRRVGDVLAYFDRPGTSNGSLQVINSRLEHLRGTAPGFRNIHNYSARALVDTGGFRPRIHPFCDEAPCPDSRLNARQ